MLPLTDSNSDFYVLQLATEVEPASMQKWIAEISFVINTMGGKSIIPSAIGRTEPIFRRQGALVIDEPLNESMKRGAISRLKTLCIAHEISAYIAHDAKTVKLAKTLRKTWPAPIIFIYHKLIKETGFFARKSSKLDINQIDHFIVPSLAASDHLMTAFEIEKRRISIVREGLDLAHISDQKISHERTVSLAHSWGVIEKVDEIVLIPQVFSSLKWQNNLISLLSNWTKMGRDDVHFVVIGDDEGSAALSQLSSKISRQCPSISIQFVGHCADLEAAIKLSSMIAILNGDTKISYSNALLAQAIGRFVILPSSTASKEFILNGESGKIAKNQDEYPQIIAAAIDRDERERKADAESGRKFITENNSRAAMHAALKAVFENDRIA